MRKSLAVSYVTITSSVECIEQNLYPLWALPYWIEQNSFLFGWFLFVLVRLFSGGFVVVVVVVWLGLVLGVLLNQTNEQTMHVSCNYSTHIEPVKFGKVK